LKAEQAVAMHLGGENYVNLVVLLGRGGRDKLFKLTDRDAPPLQEI